MTTISKTRLIGREIRARRKGGSVVHVMELTEAGHAPSSGALCGDKPRQDRYSSMNRAGWYQMKEHVEINCPKCLKILNAREQAK
ncbi:TPA: hypothetical protein L1N02_003252 [Escherichia coli]|jgi:hypothetical protein|uniref:hypothetical protein n=1 Tax=Escherichia coli TaxID=562 RepID=UPI00050B95B3|nr:hypothetical protein [Escherichia coli]HAW8321082.1 hypothetical protein [Escherichia coli]HBK9562449.1 hypothetical protein [Escherichia coli]HBN0460163.1 hypothetical protein [Escherichia coli]HBN0500842.1 hypothetical protein [Escherichia coli]HBN0670122.1 hypothetical protein [Escherichia coli]